MPLRWSSVLGVVFCALLVAGVAAANDRSQEDLLASGDVQLVFTDQAGDRADMPYIGITAAYPGMEPQIATATLVNRADVPVNYDLSIALTAPPEVEPLADRLVAEVSRKGQVVYRGPLSQLVVSASPPLPPYGSARYRVALTWPDGGEWDNQYQGANVTFDIVARGRQAAD